MLHYSCSIVVLWWLAGCCAHLQAGLVGLEDGGLSVGLLLNLVVAARQAGAGVNYLLLMSALHSDEPEPHSAHNHGRQQVAICVSITGCQ